MHSHRLKRIVIAAFTVLALGSAMAHADEVAHIVLRRIAAARSTPRSTSHVNGTVALFVLSKQDLRRSSARGKHAAVAVSFAGDVVGALLRPNGVPVCDFGGNFDGQCLTLTGCVNGTDCM
jgi:hypothetical protein